jgi:hypothetical protein
MNYFDLYSSYPDHAVTAAWESQLTDAAETPWLEKLLLERAGEFFPRFATCYRELRALPRGTRRKLQRRLAQSDSLLTARFSEWFQAPGWPSLQHKLACSLAGAALLMTRSQGVAAAATISVTTRETRVRPDGQCSLIEAIVNANADAAVFSDCPAGDGADTIVLPARANLGVKDVYDDTYGSTGLPLITSTITIDGKDARIRRQGGAPIRLFGVSKTGNLTIQNVEVSHGSSYSGGGILNNGTLAIRNSTISGNSGNAAVLNQATLTIENSTISGNEVGVQNGGRGPSYSPSSVSSLKPGAACFYSYISYWYYYYGVVSCQYIYSGALTITNSTISRNSGVGIWNHSGTVTIGNNTNISRNKGGGAFNSGGVVDFYGKYVPAGDMSIIDSTISKNSAPRGGGIFNGGIFTIENSVISENKADDDGGGIFNARNYNNAPAGDLSLLDTTISENRARDSGGGVFNEGSLVMSDTVISGNKARTGANVFP